MTTFLFLIILGHKGSVIRQVDFLRVSITIVKNLKSEEPLVRFPNGPRVFLSYLSPQQLLDISIDLILFLA